MRRIALVLVLCFTTVSLFGQAEPPARVEIDSKILGEKRVARVQLPPSYRTGATRYPVLYMTDGDAQLAHTAATAAFLAREGRMPEVIVVGVSNTDRTRDLTPTRVENETFGTNQRFNFPTSGGADKFLSFFETELIPEIERRYRTQPYRVFAGHSFGGLFAMHSLFAKPKLFNAWIAVSPSLNWDNRYVSRRAEEFVKANPELNATLVFTLGDEEPVKQEFEALKKFFAKKSPKGFEVSSYYFDDEDHGSVVMPSHYAGLRKVFEGWRFPVTQAEDPKTLLNRATEHFAKLSKRAGYEVLVPENLVNQIGYRLLQAGNVTESIEVFRRNVALYPKSANVYDSLGEALERAGQLAQAKESYERAAQIGTDTNDANLPIFRQNAERVAKSLTN